VDVPKDLSARQRELFEELRKSFEGSGDEKGEPGVFGLIFGKE
jgi:hypothetical protein